MGFIHKHVETKDSVTVTDKNIEEKLTCLDSSLQLRGHVRAITRLLREVGGNISLPLIQGG